MSRHWLAALAVPLLASAAFAAPKPNVVVILADDQGWGDLSINGNTNLRTPHIDSLAKDGARFDRFFVQPVCSPTRAELLTGRWHPRGGVRGVSTGLERLNLDEKTIADAFQAAGYATGCFGKWHNGSQYPYHPLGRGFAEYYGFTSGHWGAYFDAPLEHNGRAVKGKGYITDDLTDRAIAFLKKGAAEKKPVFCYLALNTPHSPMQVPEKYWRRFEKAKLKQTGTGKEDLGHTRAALAMCENIDDNVGRLLAALKQSKLDDHTIVVYFSDNGPNGPRWNGGMKGRKGSTDEGGVRSPLHVRWPGKVKAGTVVTPIAAAIDLYPTLIDLCGVKRVGKKALDGISLAPWLLGKDTKMPERVLFQHWAGRTSARDQRYRLDATGQLFDMTKDPGQKRDIAAEQPKEARRLAEAAQRWRREVVGGLTKADDRPIPVGHAALPRAGLPARDGVPHGGVQRSAPAPNCSFFTHWTKTDDRMTWAVEVAAAGKYEAIVHSTCAKGDVGSVIELTLGSAKWTGKMTQAHDPPLRGKEQDRVPRRGESYVKDFRPLSLGTVELKAGKGTLTLRATKVAGKQVADVRAVELKLLGKEQATGPKPLSEEVVKAWRKAGAEAGWMGPTRDGEDRSVFDSDRLALRPAETIPAFRLGEWKKGTIAKLPPPAGPFGLQLSKTDGADAIVKEMAGLKHLTGLKLNYTGVTDEGLRHLSGAQGLISLDLEGTKVTDQGLKHLANLKGLTRLGLWNTSVTDNGLKHLTSLKGLTSLSLGSTAVTAKGLKQLAGMKALTVLALSDVQVTDAALGALREAGLLHALTGATAKDQKRPTTALEVVSLSLTSTKVTEQGLKHLAGLKNLTTLGLPDRQVTDGALRALGDASLLHALPKASAEGGRRASRAEEVVALDLASTRVTDAGLKHLAGLTNLRELNLPPGTTNEGLKGLAGMKKLARLSLATARVTDEGLKQLAKMKELSSLSLFGTKVTDAGLKELVPLKKLTWLEVSVGDETLKSLREVGLLHALSMTQAKGAGRPARPDEVVWLNLSHTEVTNEGLKHLAGLKNLTTLILSKKVTDEGLKHLAGFKNLTWLELPRGVTDKGLKEVARLKGLTYLGAYDAQVTDTGLKALAPLKKLTWLHWRPGTVNDQTLKVLREIGLLHALGSGWAKNGTRPAGPEEVISLDLRETKVTAAGLTELKDLKQLTRLVLAKAQVTDAGLKSLREMGLLHAIGNDVLGSGQRPTRLDEVTSLDLGSTKVSEEGLKQLAGMKNLTTLWLSNTPVTDKGLEQLAGLKKLSTLWLRGTNITNNGLRKLQQALPRCQIIR